MSRRGRPTKKKSKNPDFRHLTADTWEKRRAEDAKKREDLASIAEELRFEDNSDEEHFDSESETSDSESENIYRDSYRSGQGLILSSRLRTRPIEPTDDLLDTAAIQPSACGKRGPGRPRINPEQTILQEREEKRARKRSELDSIKEHTREYLEWVISERTRFDKFVIAISTLSCLIDEGKLYKFAYKKAANDAGVSPRTVERWYHDFKENGFQFPEDGRASCEREDSLLTEQYKLLCKAFIRSKTGLSSCNLFHSF